MVKARQEAFFERSTRQLRKLLPAINGLLLKPFCEPIRLNPSCEYRTSIFLRPPVVSKFVTY
jgi:hypothetical protein